MKINFEKYIGVVFSLRKIVDLRSEGEKNPDSILEGYYIRYATINIGMSEKLNVLFVNDGPDRWFKTSNVLSIEEFEDHDLIHTMNSIYKLTPCVKKEKSTS